MCFCQSPRRQGSEGRPVESPGRWERAAGWNALWRRGSLPALSSPSLPSALDPPGPSSAAVEWLCLPRSPGSHRIGREVGRRDVKNNAGTLSPSHSGSGSRKPRSSCGLRLDTEHGRSASETERTKPGDGCHVSFQPSTRLPSPETKPRLLTVICKLDTVWSLHGYPSRYWGTTRLVFLGRG